MILAFIDVVSSKEKYENKACHSMENVSIHVPAVMASQVPYLKPNFSCFKSRVDLY